MRIVVFFVGLRERLRFGAGAVRADARGHYGARIDVRLKRFHSKLKKYALSERLVGNPGSVR